MEDKVKIIATVTIQTYIKGDEYFVFPSMAALLVEHGKAKYPRKPRTKSKK